MKPGCQTEPVQEADHGAEVRGKNRHGLLPNCARDHGWMFDIASPTYPHCQTLVSQLARATWPAEAEVGIKVRCSRDLGLPHVYVLMFVRINQEAVPLEQINLCI